MLLLSTTVIVVQPWIYVWHIPYYCGLFYALCWGHEVLDTHVVRVTVTRCVFVCVCLFVCVCVRACVRACAYDVTVSCGACIHMRPMFQAFVRLAEASMEVFDVATARQSFMQAYKLKVAKKTYVESEAVSLLVRATAVSTHEASG